MSQQYNAYLLLKEAILDEASVEIIPINMTVNETRRINDKRPASIRFSCTDEWAKNMGGYSALKDVFLAIRLPREWVDRQKPHSASPAESEGSDPEPATPPQPEPVPDSGTSSNTPC